MYARCAAMHDTLQLLLLPTGIEQYARSLDMRPAIKFRWHARMIQVSDEMIDQRYAIDRLLHPHRVGNVTWNNCDRLSKLATCLLHIPSENTYILLLFD